MVSQRQEGLLYFAVTGMTKSVVLAVAFEALPIKNLVELAVTYGRRRRGHHWYHLSQLP